MEPSYGLIGGLAAALPAIASRAARDGNPRVLVDGQIELRYPLVTRLMVALFCALSVSMIGVLVISMVLDGTVSGSGDWAAFVFLTSLAGICVWASLEVERTRILVSDWGLRAFSPWRESRNYEWKEITTVGFSSILRRYKIHSFDRPAIHLNFFMLGLEDFKTFARKHLPENRYEHAFNPNPERDIDKSLYR